MVTMTSPALYIHDGGAIACPAHFGAYAAAERRRSPGSRLLATPLGCWERLSADDLEDLAAMGVTPACETCAARARSRRVFLLAEKLARRPLARAVVPQIALKGPKISRKLTTEWFADRVNERHRRCLARAAEAGSGSRRDDRGVN
jgi:hypothetical protein